MQLLPCVVGGGQCARRLHRRGGSSHPRKVDRRSVMPAVASIGCGILSGFRGLARAKHLEGGGDRRQAALQGRFRGEAQIPLSLGIWAS